MAASTSSASLGSAAKAFGVESGGSALEALELTTRELARQQGQALVIVPGSVLSATEGRQVPEDQAFGLATEQMADPRIVVACLSCPPVVREDSRRERLPGFRQLSALVQRHGEDEAGHGSVEARRVATHRGDGLVKFPLHGIPPGPGRTGTRGTP